LLTFKFFIFEEIYKLEELSSKFGRGSFLFVGDCPFRDLEKFSRSVESKSYVKYYNKILENKLLN